MSVVAFVTNLIHFALNDPYYSPYDVTYDVIGNPHYSASYPYVFVDLGLQLRLGLHANSLLSHLRAGPPLTSCLRHH